MAKKEVLKDKGNSFLFVHKLVSGVGLLMFIVILINGVKVEASISSIVVRSGIAIIVVGMIARVLIKILRTYQEMNSE